MERIDLIDLICKRCRYYKTNCYYDYGDSLTKIPCEALRYLAYIMFMFEGIEFSFKRGEIK